MKRYIIYLGRWQLSSPILAACLMLLPFSPISNTIIANLIGGAVFFWVDRLIFKAGCRHEQHKSRWQEEEH